MDVESAPDQAEAILIAGRYWCIALLPHLGLSCPCAPHIAQVACTARYMAYKGPEPTGQFVHVLGCHTVREGLTRSWQSAHEVPVQARPLTPSLGG